MAEYLFQNVPVHVRQITEEHSDEGTLPGMIQVGVDVGGHFLVLLERKAPGVLADIERAKKRSAEQTATSPTQPQQG